MFMKQSVHRITLLLLSVVTLSGIYFASAAEKVAASPPPAGPKGALNTELGIAQIDAVKVQLAALKAEIANAQAKIQEQTKRIEELKKECAANKQEAKFATTVLTTGVNKMGDDFKALASEFKSHTHSFTVGNGVISAGSLFASLQHNPNYNVTLVTSSGHSDGRTSPPSAK